MDTCSNCLGIIGNPSLHKARVGNPPFQSKVHICHHKSAGYKYIQLNFHKPSVPVCRTLYFCLGYTHKIANDPANQAYLHQEKFPYPVYNLVLNLFTTMSKIMRILYKWSSFVPAALLSLKWRYLCISWNLFPDIVCENIGALKNSSHWPVQF